MLQSIPSTSGIYRITCITTGKFYIGSAVSLLRRWQRHIRDLDRNIHDNPKLQRAYTKYGPVSFEFDILEFVLIPEMLIPREQHWIDKLNPQFNIARVAGSNLGAKYSPESVEQSRVARTGMKRTPEQCENIGASRRGKPSPNIGRKAAPETIEKLRASHLGQKPSEETLQKRSAALKGRKRSTEAIEKTRLKNLGRTNSPEANARISAAKQGHKHDEEVYEGRRKSYILMSPEGEEHIVHGLKRFCREHNLSCSHLVQVALGHAQHHKGWKAHYLD